MNADNPVAAEILRQAMAAGPGASISPIDVAQALAPAWRPLLGAVRREAVRLLEAGRLEILRKGKPVAPAEVRGVIRLRIPAGPPGAVPPEAATKP